MSWKHGIQTSRRTDSLIGLAGLAVLLALAVAFQVKQPTAEAATAPTPATTAIATPDQITVNAKRALADELGKYNKLHKRPFGPWLTTLRSPNLPAPSPEDVDKEITTAIMLTVQYDANCEKIPFAAKDILITITTTIPDDIFTSTNNDLEMRLDKVTHRPTFCRYTQMLADKVVAAVQPALPTTEQFLADIAVLVNYHNLCGNVPEWKLSPAIVKILYRMQQQTPPNTFGAAVMKAKPHPGTMGYCDNTSRFVQNFTRNFFRNN